MSVCSESSLPCGHRGGNKFLFSSSHLTLCWSHCWKKLTRYVHLSPVRFKSPSQCFPVVSLESRQRYNMAAADRRVTSTQSQTADLNSELTWQDVVGSFWTTCFSHRWRRWAPVILKPPLTTIQAIFVPHRWPIKPDKELQHVQWMTESNRLLLLHKCNFVNNLVSTQDLAADGGSTSPAQFTPPSLTDVSSTDGTRGHARFNLAEFWDCGFCLEPADLPDTLQHSRTLLEFLNCFLWNWEAKAEGNEEDW